MMFAPADGETARWRRVDEYIDSKKSPGDLISFREIQDFLGIGKPAVAGIIHQVRIQREKAGKPTLVTMRGAGWLLARPDHELAEDTRRNEHLLNAAGSRIRLLGSLQARRSELTEDERRALDFRQAQAAAQATILDSRKASATDILSTGGSQHVPITARKQRSGKESQTAGLLAQLAEPGRDLPVTSTGHTRQQHAGALAGEDRLVTLRDQVKAADEELILRSCAHHGSIATTALAADATWLTVTAVLGKHGITHAMDTDATRPQIAQPWRPVAGSLRSQIADSTCKPGDLLPRISDLRAAWGVSSPLVTRAFKALNDEHLIQLIQGNGWIVRQHSGPARYSLHGAAGGLLDVTQGNDPVPGTRGWAAAPGYDPTGTGTAGGALPSGTALARQVQEPR
jgi:DNA-binding transcriptional regulator YhcF (GntR family)